MSFLPLPLALDLKAAGWPQHLPGSGMHFARVHPEFPTEPSDFICMPSATALLAALLQDGHAAKAQEVLAKAWIEAQEQKAKRGAK